MVAQHLCNIFPCKFVRLFASTYILRTRRHQSTSTKHQNIHVVNAKNRANACTNCRAYFSKSNDIFENLALERWYFDNEKLEDYNVLFMWISSPTIVVGRHQNIWKECDVVQANKLGIQLARRESGGGTVYHDEGNLNCSLLSLKKNFNRELNLRRVTECVRKEYGIDLTATQRYDIMIDNHKISGSAAKLTDKNAYHHWTVLVDADKKTAGEILHSPLQGSIVTKATESLRSMVKNLTDINSSVSMKHLVPSLAKYFNAPHVEEVEPKHKYKYPGLSESNALYTSWRWIYGKTPKFSYVQSIPKSKCKGCTEELIEWFVEQGLVTSVKGADLTFLNFDDVINEKFSPQLLAGVNYSVHQMISNASG